MYSDFESFLLPVFCCTREEDRSHTLDIARHVPCRFCYVIVDWTGEAVNDPVLYRGKDVVETFLCTRTEDVSRLERDFGRPLRTTEDDERVFQNATTWHLCKKSIEHEWDKVRNHDHVTGEYLGACLLYTSRCV